MSARVVLDGSDLVFVLIGASAVGKSTIAKRLSETGIVEVTPTWATRVPRRDESEAELDRRLVGDAEFDRLDGAGSFIDTREFYDARYGVPVLHQPTNDREALIVLKPVFMSVFLEHYPSARVYQIDASPEVLPRRMKARGQAQADIDVRMSNHESEVADSRRFAHANFNNDSELEQTLRSVQAQILADRKAFEMQ